MRLPQKEMARQDEAIYILQLWKVATGKIVRVSNNNMKTIKLLTRY